MEVFYGWRFFGDDEDDDKEVCFIELVDDFFISN